MIEFKYIVQALKYMVFPKRCYLCGRVIAPEEDECPVCEKEVRRIQLPVCYRCAAEKERCRCKKHRNRFVTAFVSPFYYTGKVKSSIYRLKFGKERDIAISFGKEMASFVRKAYEGVKFDLITYVPMTEKEYLARGFNQVEIMADAMSENLGIPCRKVLSKLYETKSQRSLKERYRSGNVLGVFDVCDRDAVKNKTILLCDDVLTTGATLTECAKMLMIRGAREVMCVTAVVGIPKGKRR